MTDTSWIYDFIRGSARSAAHRQRGETTVEPKPDCPDCHGTGFVSKSFANGEGTYRARCECTWSAGSAAPLHD
jgi:hypothetical protein